MRIVECTECKTSFETDAATAPFCSMRCRLRANIDVGGKDDCWPWKKFTHRGYGRVTSYDRETGKWKTERAHRLVYLHEVGPIPDGLVVMHSCDNPKCCNPNHLTLGTQARNLIDMAEKGRAGRKIDAETARKIRDDKRSSRAAAAAFGVSPSLVKQIRSGAIWSHI